MLFYDSRVTANSLPTSPRHVFEATLHLAFSGRQITQKGFPDALEAFRLARQRGLDAHLHVFGYGELHHLLDHANPDITDHGVVPYTPEWTDFISSKVDALLIPHTQGDPSCTYIEGMGCGVPFISYNNDAAHHLAETSNGGGITVPMGNVNALATLLCELGADRTRLARARQAALAFAANHTFEQTMQARRDHLRACA